MRIDIVTDTFAPDINGVAMTLGRLSDGLRSRGHRIHIIRSGPACSEQETSAAAVPLPGYSEVRIGLPKPFELRARWLRRRPDVIYVATESPLGKSALKAANALRIPVASGFHTNFHQYMERYGIGGLRPVAMSYLQKFHQRADLTLTPSRDAAAELSRNGLPNVQWLGRGVDTTLFSPAKRCENLRRTWGAGPSSIVVTTVGRVAPEKNLDHAIACYQAMRNAFPDTRFVITGDGPLRAKLQAANPWIHFAGMRTGEELARHYASADILLFPSETETFGNVLLEGMASGLAVVAYDYAAAAIHIRHGENGFVAPFGEPDAYSQRALDAMRALPAGELRADARATAESLSWAQVVENFEHHLTSITTTEPTAASTKYKPDKRPKLHCRTVFISDVHLGTPDSKTDEIVEFLKHIRCEKLVLNGDIIDGWALRRGGKWTSRHSRVIRKFLKLGERDGTRILYLRGNHDEILDRFLPLAFGNIQFLKEHIHETADGKKYLVVHGDGFDSVSTDHKWVAALGAVGYDFLLSINRLYNRWRAWRGLEYYSISKRIKARVKSAVCFVDKYQTLLEDLATRRKCEGIICGHIHTPADSRVGDIHYLNSGDWVESLTAIIEHLDGRMELVHHADFIASLHAVEKPTARQKPDEIPAAVS